MSRVHHHAQLRRSTELHRTRPAKLLGWANPDSTDYNRLKCCGGLLVEISWVDHPRVLICKSTIINRVSPFPVNYAICSGFTEKDFRLEHLGPQVLRIQHETPKLSKTWFYTERTFRSRWASRLSNPGAFHRTARSAIVVRRITRFEVWDRSDQGRFPQATLFVHVWSWWLTKVTVIFLVCDLLFACFGMFWQGLPLVVLVWLVVVVFCGLVSFLFCRWTFACLCLSLLGERFDHDGSNYLDQNEFKYLCAYLGLSMSRKVGRSSFVAVWRWFFEPTGLMVNRDKIEA